MTHSHYIIVSYAWDYKGAWHEQPSGSESKKNRGLKLSLQL